jgi:hypothetical protein
MKTEIIQIISHDDCPQCNAHALFIERIIETGEIIQEFCKQCNWHASVTKLQISPKSALRKAITMYRYRTYEAKTLLADIDKTQDKHNYYIQQKFLSILESEYNALSDLYKTLR